MMRSVSVLSLAAWTLAGACSGGRNDAPDAGAAAGDAPAEAPPPGGAGARADQAQSFDRGTVRMKIAAEVGGKSYRAEGLGECASSGAASIYGAPATQWAARYDGRGSDFGHLNLTVWRLESGGDDQANLSILIGETSHRIATVKGGQQVGLGKAGVSPAGPGGTLTVEGEDAHGDAVRLTVDCARFDEVVAEGG